MANFLVHLHAWCGSEEEEEEEVLPQKRENGILVVLPIPQDYKNSDIKVLKRRNSAFAVNDFAKKIDSLQ